MMNGGPIALSSARGKAVATSTCEAEINAAVVAAKEALYFAQLMRGLGFELPSPNQIGEDNAVCIAQANSGLRLVRNAKHYQVKLCFFQ